MRELQRQARTHSIFIQGITGSADSKGITGIRADVPCLNEEMGKLERTGLFVTVLGNWKVQAQGAGFSQGPSCFSILLQKTEEQESIRTKQGTQPLFQQTLTHRMAQHTHKNRSEAPVTSKCCCLQCATQELARIH